MTTLRRIFTQRLPVLVWSRKGVYMIGAFFLLILAMHRFSSDHVIEKRDLDNAMEATTVGLSPINERPKSYQQLIQEQQHHIRRKTIVKDAHAGFIVRNMTEYRRQLQEQGRPRTFVTRAQCKNADWDAYFHPKNRTEKYAFNYPILLQPKSDFCTKKTFLLFVVSTHHENVHKRDVTRKTWGSLAKMEWPVSLGQVVIPPIKVLFLFGRHSQQDRNDLILSEHTMHGDVLQADFYESYQNLSLKSILGLKFATEHCRSAKYIIKLDDDIFVNIPLIIKLLTQNDFHRMVIGRCYNHPYVRRAYNYSRTSTLRGHTSHTESWSIPCSEYPLTSYPTYAAGHAYIITNDMVPEMYRASKSVHPISVEDAFVSGILRTFAGNGANVTCPEGFSAFEHPQPFISDFYRKTYTTAYWNTSQPYDLWEGMMTHDYSRDQESGETVTDLQELIGSKDKAKHKSSLMGFFSNLFS